MASFISTSVSMNERKRRKFSDFTMQGLADSNLSTGESAIYDRQIRLWGSNAQLRIKASRVLFIGLSAATVEIAKNTVLAGASVIVEDTRRIDESTTNFLIQLEVDDTASTFRVLFHICSSPL